MNVYIGTNSMKNAYIGEVYEYSYDFRNKSSTILTNDGWTAPSSYGTNSNYSYTTWGSNQLSNRCRYTISKDLSGAKKITINVGYYNLTAKTGDTFTHLGDSSDNRGIAIYTTTNGGSVTCVLNAGGTAVNYSPTLVSGHSEINVIVDLVNLTIVGTYNGTTFANASITQSQANNVKARAKILSWVSQSSNDGLQYIKLTVE